MIFKMHVSMCVTHVIVACALCETINTIGLRTTKLDLNKHVPHHMMLNTDTQLRLACLITFVCFLVAKSEQT